MTSDEHVKQRSVKGATQAEGKFRRKFESTSRPGPSDILRDVKSKPAKEPGLVERKRVEVRRASRVTWNWLGGDPLKESDKEPLTYRVRGGKLTITDKDGRVISESREKGLEKYNGVTLHGEAGEKGDIRLKSTLLSKKKLEEGNQYVTPREKKEAAEDKVRGADGKLKELLNPFKKRKDKSLAKTNKRIALRIDQRKRAKDWHEGRMH